MPFPSVFLGGPGGGKSTLKHFIGQVINKNNIEIFNDMTLGTMKPQQSSKLASFRGDTFRGDTHFQVVSPLLNYRYTNYNQHLHCNVEVTFTIFTSPKKKTTVFFSRYVCQGIFVKPQQRSNQPSQLKPHPVEVSV